MAKGFSMLLIALLVMGFTVAGCGDDDDKGSDNAGSTATTEQTETTAVSGGDTDASETKTDDKAEGSTSSGDDNGSGGANPDVANNPQVKNAVKQCKQSVNSAPQLKDDTKKKLEDICEKAGSGDRDGLKEASKEVCLAIIEDTGISGPAAETAKKQCETIK